MGYPGAVCRLSRRSGKSRRCRRCARKRSPLRSRGRVLVAQTTFPGLRMPLGSKTALMPRINSSLPRSQTLQKIGALGVADAVFAADRAAHLPRRGVERVHDRGDRAFPRGFFQIVPADVDVQVPIAGVSERADAYLLFAADLHAAADKGSDPVARHHHVALIHRRAASLDGLEKCAARVPNALFALIRVRQQYVARAQTQRRIGQRFHRRLQRLRARPIQAHQQIRIRACDPGTVCPGSARRRRSPRAP